MQPKKEKKTKLQKKLEEAAKARAAADEKAGVATSTNSTDANGNVTGSGAANPAGPTAEELAAAAALQQTKDDKKVRIYRT